MAAIDSEILVCRQNDGISENFRHANKAGISEAHGNIGIFFDQLRDGLEVFGKLEGDNKGRSAMARSEAVRRRRRRGASSNLSRTTSDFEIFRPRDSASMSATRGSGRRTVRVFIASVYYISDSSARQAGEPASLPTTVIPRRFSGTLDRSILKRCIQSS